MNLRNDKRQNIQRELGFSSGPVGEARRAGRKETESFRTVNVPESPASTNRLMEEVCERENLMEALRRVKANKGRKKRGHSQFIASLIGVHILVNAVDGTELPNSGSGERIGSQFRGFLGKSWQWQRDDVVV